jgi:hypothetical protein
MNSRRPEECVYCGATAQLTDDHIPPKNLFPPPRPSTLITVRSCPRHNLDSSLDDEYFRDMLALRADVSGNPAAERVRGAVLRSLDRPTKQAFRDVFHGSFQRILLYGPDGKPVVDKQTYNVSVDRLGWVVARTTAGLFSRHMGRRLPTDRYLVGANLATEVEFERNPVLEWGRQKLLSASENMVAPGVYRYRYAELRVDPNCTVWWHTFYDTVDFIAATMPTKEVREHEAV